MRGIRRELRVIYRRRAYGSIKGKKTFTTSYGCASTWVCALFKGVADGCKEGRTLTVSMAMVISTMIRETSVLGMQSH